MPTCQTHEDDLAKIIIVCAPSALSKMMGSLHPAGALYEKPVNTAVARHAHQSFVNLLERRGIQVREIRQILTDRASWSVGDRLALENLAFNCLSYNFENRKTTTPPSSPNETTSLPTSTTEQKIPDAEHYYISDKYKRTVIEQSDVQQLVDIIFTNPTVTVTPSLRDTGFTASYKFEPLSNIVFVRDQQITTRRGVIMARLKSTQRAREVDILEFCLNKIGVNIIGRIPPPGHLEGGDYIPAGKGLCFLGIGPRSDWTAAKYLLQNDLFGTMKVAIVKDNFEKKQERMHLDTVFSIIGHDCCIMLEDMIGTNSSTKRLVDEYVLVDDDNNDDKDEQKKNQVGRYRLVNEDIEFSKYVEDHGYHIIPVKGGDQLNYGCNCLNLGDGHIVSIERNVARQIARSEQFQGTVEFLDFSGVTCMYGGVHCASQVVYREEATESSNGSNNVNGSISATDHGKV